MLRKKLKDKDAELADCKAAIQQRENEVVIKERVIAERDGVVDELKQQISRLTAQLQLSVDNLDASGSTSAFTADAQVCNYLQEPSILYTTLCQVCPSEPIANHLNLFLYNTNLILSALCLKKRY